MELVLIACLIANPAECREDRIAMLELPGPVACLIVAPQVAADWMAAHPKWAVARWRCAPVGSGEVRA